MNWKLWQALQEFPAHPECGSTCADKSYHKRSCFSHINFSPLAAGQTQSRTQKPSPAFAISHPSSPRLPAQALNAHLVTSFTSSTSSFHQRLFREASSIHFIPYISVSWYFSCKLVCNRARFILLKKKKKNDWLHDDRVVFVWPGSCLQHDLWFFTGAETGNLSGGDACSSWSDWGFHASHTRRTFHVCVFGPRADARCQTFSPRPPEAWVHASSLPQLMEPNPLLIFPQRAVSPRLLMWCSSCNYSQLEPLTASLAVHFRVNS